MLIAQITDLHLGTEVRIDGVAVDTFEALRTAVEHLNSFDPRPDAVIATGDLTDEGRPQEYRALRELLSPLPMPVYLIPGNHDHRENMRSAFASFDYLRNDSEFLHHVIDDYELRLIGLDTHVPGESGGLQCERRLSWLAATLAEAPQKPTFIYMHHPPFDTGIPEFDGMGLSGADALGTVVARHSQIVGISCGHIHRAMNLRWAGTVVNVAPSSAFHYPLKFRATGKLAPVLEPPACLMHHWTRNAELVSHLSYIRR